MDDLLGLSFAVIAPAPPEAIEVSMDFAGFFSVDDRFKAGGTALAAVSNAPSDFVFRTKFFRPDCGGGGICGSIEAGIDASFSPVSSKTGSSSKDLESGIISFAGICWYLFGSGFVRSFSTWIPLVGTSSCRGLGIGFVIEGSGGSGLEGTRSGIPLLLRIGSVDISAAVGFTGTVLRGVINGMSHGGGGGTMATSTSMGL